MDEETEYPVKAVRTNVRIIEALRELDGAGVSELARHLDLSKSSVHDHLRTLVACGYVETEDTIYRLGPEFVKLGGHARGRTPLYRVAEGEVADLARETRTRAAVTIELRGEGVQLIDADRAEEATASIDPGETLSLSETAPGRAILASLPRDRLERMLFSAPGAGGDGGVADDLQRIRRRGYAVDAPDSEVRRVAVPIDDPRDRTHAALSVAGAAERIGTDGDDDPPRRVPRRGSIGTSVPSGPSGRPGRGPDRDDHRRGSIGASRPSDPGDGHVSSEILAAVKRTAREIESQLGDL